MLLQQLAKGFAENAHAAAVDYADAREARQECLVHKSLDSSRSLVHGLADHVDLAGDVFALVF